jgi:ribonuclease VapC
MLPLKHLIVITALNDLHLLVVDIAIPIATRRFDQCITEAKLCIESVTEIQAKIAREAYRDFGKGSGHPARLNFGDCFCLCAGQGKW